MWAFTLYAYKTFTCQFSVRNVCYIYMYFILPQIHKYIQEQYNANELVVWVKDCNEHKVWTKKCSGGHYEGI